MTSIRLHPQHGVNPTLPLCFWCGKEKGEVALLGAAYKGEAPPSMVLDYEPCDACREVFAQGILIAEAEPRLGDAPRLTGRFVVLKPDAVPQLFSPPELVTQVLEARKALIEPAAFQQLFGQVNTESQEKPS